VFQSLEEEKRRRKGKGMIGFPLYVDVLKIKIRNGRNDKTSYKLIIISFFYSI
jgi:hypothetical protein